MTIQTQLDDLRHRIPGCTLVAYGDRAARLVLRTSAAAPWRQERLDALCASGAQHLARAERLDQSLDQSLAHPSATPSAEAPVPSGPEAVVAIDGELRLFLGAARSESADIRGSDVLCCVVSPGSETGAALDLARAALDTLPAGGA